MDKNVSILEGNSSYKFTTQKLRTALTGGGTCDWVPEDTVNLQTLNVKENGVYEAQPNGFYGWGEVNVDVKVNSVVGTDPDGNEHEVHISDGTDGNPPGTIVDTKLPSSISVSRAPTKTVYVDGEAIDITGIFVIASYADGTQWIDDGTHTEQSGNIKVSELTIDPTTAHADEESKEWTDGDGVNAIKAVAVTPVSPRGTPVCYRIPEVPNLGLANAGDTILLTVYNNECYAADYYGKILHCLVDRSGDSIAGTNYYASFGSAFKKDNNLTNYCTPFENIPISTKNPTQAGELHPTGQTITVKWHRPRDNKELTATFEIEVTENE